MRVLIGCEFSGIVRDAFIRQGHQAVSCDFRPTERPGPHIQADVITVLNDGWDMAVFHPTCTRLTNSGVRWLSVPPNGRTLVSMWKELFEGADFYKALRNAPIPKIAIENPIMHCHARELIQPKPRQTVQPWWFGDPFFKATGFELFGLPNLQPTNKLTPPPKGSDEHKEWSAIHRASPGPSREKERSRSFPGMAEAMAKQWGDEQIFDLFPNH